MTPIGDSEQQETLNNLINSGDPLARAKAKELFSLFTKAQSQNQKDKKVDSDCPDCPDDDCREVLSPCCHAKIHILSGTLPLEVVCTACEQVYLLSKIMLDQSVQKTESVL